MDSFTATQYTHHQIRGMTQGFKPLKQARFEALVAKILSSK